MRDREMNDRELDKSVSESSASSRIADEVGKILRREPRDIDPDANLFELGLGSLQMTRLVTRLRRTDRRISFRTMAAQPTLAAWSRYLDSLRT